MNLPLVEDKASLRSALLARRDSIPPEVRRAKDRLILANLLGLGEVRNAQRLLLFASFRSEFDTTLLIKDRMSEGRRVILPKVDRNDLTLRLYEIGGMEELQKGYMGIPEPSVLTDSRHWEIGSVGLVIIPGAGYDPSGNRIGYGGGYYDRLLAGDRDKVFIVAPAYDEQVVELVPSEPHDIRVDVIVTDRRVIRTAQSWS